MSDASKILLRDANYSQLIAAIAHKLGKNECLILGDLSDDDPSSKHAWVIIEGETELISRSAIKAHGR